MGKIIVYEKPNGKISVVHPAPGVPIAKVLERIPPDAINVDVIDDDKIPNDRVFRAAWVKSGSKVIVDLNKAKLVFKDKIRDARKLDFPDLDSEYLRADESNDSAKKNEIALKKKELRDLTSDPRIDAASSVSELKSLWPSVLSKKNLD